MAESGEENIPDEVEKNLQNSEDENLEEKKPKDENLEEKKPKDENLEEKKPDDENLEEKKTEDENLEEKKPDDENLEEKEAEDFLMKAEDFEKNIQGFSFEKSEKTTYEERRRPASSVDPSQKVNKVVGPTTDHLPLSCRVVVVEVERCTGCSRHQYCTHHDENDYLRHLEALRNIFRIKYGPDFVQHKSGCYAIVDNPGPQSHGVVCRQDIYERNLYVTLRKDANTQKYHPGIKVQYPRIGAFEIYLKKYFTRNKIYSKLESRKFPNPDHIIKNSIPVLIRFGGWDMGQNTRVVRMGILKSENWSKFVKRKPQTAPAIVVTDSNLRSMIRRKFSTIISAFRSFDKNKDGKVSRDEFFKGIQSAGVLLHAGQRERLLKMVDPKNLGYISYDSFGRNFTTYRVSQTMTFSQNDVVTAQVRKDVNIEPTGEQRDKQVGRVKFLKTDFISNDLKLLAEAIKFKKDVRLVEMDIDELRALMINKYGCLTSAFKQFDINASASIEMLEFFRLLPIVLKVSEEEIPRWKCLEWWEAMDLDMSGCIDLREFTRIPGSGVKKQEVGISILRGQTMSVEALAKSFNA